MDFLIKERTECKKYFKSFEISYDTEPFKIRNIALVSIIDKNKILWEKCLQFKHCFFIEFEEKENIPNLEFFRDFSIIIAKRRRFIQILHNMIAYQGLPWINEFLHNNSCNIIGTKYMILGNGDIEIIKKNIIKWKTKILIEYFLSITPSENIQVKEFLLNL